MSESWYLKGEYFENCNCNVVCQCVVNGVGILRVVPNSAEGDCRVTHAFSIEDGRCGDVDLSGLNVVRVMISPPGQPMIAGNFSLALYLDDRASPQQSEALGAVFGGKAGGGFALLSALVSTVLGVRAATISYEKDGKKRRVKVDGVTEVEVEMISGHRGGGEPLTISGVNDMDPSRPLGVAVVRSSSFKDYGMEWDNTGKNSFHSPMDLKGP
jgi:hypothetical protein